MDKSRRKELVSAYNDVTPPKGVFAVRCAATGQAWVATSKNLTQQQNGVWFQLKHNGHPNKALQALWNKRGEDAFAFEVLEAIEEEGLTALGLADLLKSKAREWREALGAQALVG